VTSPLRSTLRLAALLGVAALAPAPAAGHDVWIEPSSHRPATGERLEVRLVVGEKFRGEPVPRRSDRIERFAAELDGERREILGLDGVAPAGVARLDRDGTWLLVYDNRPAEIELPGDRFELHLAQEGLERIAELRRARGESGRAARERYSRSVKSLVTAGDPASASSGFDRVLGLELELVPESDPRRLAGPAEVPFRLFFRGAPVEGVLVTAYPGSAPESAASSRTDDDGRVSLPIAPGDRWLVRAVHMVPASEPGIDFESFWAALTFESFEL
jgi:uncharacterized GH25 family protein